MTIGYSSTITAVVSVANFSAGDKLLNNAHTATPVIVTAPTATTLTVTSTSVYNAPANTYVVSGTTFQSTGAPTTNSGSTNDNANPLLPRSD